MAAATDTPSALDLAAARRERSPWGDAWNQLIKNRLAIASLVYIIVLTADVDLRQFCGAFRV